LSVQLTSLQKELAMIDDTQARDLPGRDLLGAGREKVGRIGQVYLDDDTGRPDWVTVHTGLFGTKENFVPLVQAELVDEGLTVPYPKDKITSAPNLEAEGHLSREEEAALYRHYGLEYESVSASGRETAGEVPPTTPTTADRPAETSAPTAAAGGARGEAAGDESDRDRDRDRDLAAGTERESATADISGRDVQVASEEQIREDVAAGGRTRLRRYVVTEEITTRVQPLDEEEAGGKS
jgi:hypothetical protein